VIAFTIPLRTVSGMNQREHWRKRAARVKQERAIVAASLYGAGLRQFTLTAPLLVTLTRIGPTNGLDPFDNLPSALKGCVDEIASWLGVDDRKDDRVRYACKQERGPKWLVRVEIEGVAAMEAA
jgi:hypothetical protein